MARPSVNDVGVLDKVMAILGVLEATPRSLAQITAATGHHRATVHRLLHAMEAHGLSRLDRARTGTDSPGGIGRASVGVDGWTLGSRLIELGRLAATGLPLLDAAGPALERLRRETGESVQLYVRDGDKRVCVASLESPHGLRTIVSVGAVLPLEVGSAGKVLRRDAAALKRGWSESVGEREAGVASVSAAVRGLDGDVRAAVSVSGPIERTTRTPGRRYATAVVRAARAIESAAGWSTLSGDDDAT